MNELSKNIMARLDEFTTRQGIVSAEWCKLLDATEKHLESLELELASTKKMLDEAKEVINDLIDTDKSQAESFSKGRLFLAKHEKKEGV